MARLSSLPKGQWDRFDRLLNSTDLSAEEVLKLIEHPEALNAALDAMRNHPTFVLIHGVFNKQEDVLTTFKTYHEAKGIDFGKFSWVGPKAAPDFDPTDPETVVVLDATQDTLQNTFEFAWQWTCDGQDDKYRWEGMVSDSKKLRLLSDDRKDDAEGDSPEFKPWTIAWRRIKLDTNVGKRPIDVRDPKSSPGCALLFMSAEHPARIKATDYKKRFGYWLPGLKCSAPGERQWRSVPDVSFGRDGRRVGLDSDPDDYSLDGLAVPSFRE
ncbi:MAG: hypothetical protein WC641_03490 [Patescibacteria group bacterium]